RKLSISEVIDIFINAMDTRMLILAEGLINMEKKIKELMLESVWKRAIIIGLVIAIGFGGGYLISQNTPSIFNLSPQWLLLIGVSLGLFMGYVLGIVRGILRVVNVTQREDVILPTGRLRFDKVEK